MRNKAGQFVLRRSVQIRNTVFCKFTKTFLSVKNSFSVFKGYGDAGSAFGDSGTVGHIGFFGGTL